MSEHRAALSQRLSQQRFRPLDALPDDELRLLNSLENTHINSLPPEVVQQVRKEEEEAILGGDYCLFLNSRVTFESLNNSY